MGLGAAKASAVFALACGAFACGPPKKSAVTEAKTLEVLEPTRYEPQRLGAQTRPTLVGPAEPIDLAALPALDPFPRPTEGIVVGTQDEVDLATWKADSVEVVRTTTVLLPSRQVTTASVRAKAAALVRGLVFAVRALSVDPSKNQLMIVSPPSSYHVTSNDPERYPYAQPYVVVLLPMASGTSSTVETILTRTDIYDRKDNGAVLPNDMSGDVEGLVYTVDLVCPSDGAAVATLFRGELRTTPRPRLPP